MNEDTLDEHSGASVKFPTALFWKPTRRALATHDRRCFTFCQILNKSTITATCQASCTNAVIPTTRPIPADPKSMLSMDWMIQAPVSRN
jgi:hypothetical protein